MPKLARITQVWLETWTQDARHALRLLARTPLITALALISLALGIGATTALFSLTDAVLLRPLPVAHPSQLVALTSNFESINRGHFWPFFSNPLWEQVRAEPALFAGAFATAGERYSLTGQSHDFNLLLASGSYFTVLGIHPERGRLFTAKDDYRGCPAIADISAAFWRSHFQASPSALGSLLSVAGHSIRVIGVTPPNFFGTEVDQSFALALPMCAEAVLEGTDSFLDVRNGGYVQIFARLPRMRPWPRHSPASPPSVRASSPPCPPAPPPPSAPASACASSPPLMVPRSCVGNRA
ncbi:MAG: ABC transporter permease [Terriglobales bacterium]